MYAVPQHNNNTAAETAVKERFVRLPSLTAQPRFRDLVTGIEQGDAYILLDYHRRMGGHSSDAQHLLGCIEMVYGETFKPGTYAIVRNASGSLLNLWTAPSVKPSKQTATKEKVEPFIGFLRRLFPNDIERNYFGWWLAHAVRHPEQRIIATPVLRSEHGVGKGFLIETLMAGLIGRNSVAVCRMGDITGQFNDILEGKTILLIDEVDGASNKTMQELKSLTGSSLITLRRKFKPSINIENYINFIIASNFTDAIKIEPGDRRFWIPEFIGHMTSRHETESFINQTLKPWLLDNGLQLVRDFLESIDLTTYSPTSSAPMTTSKKQLMDVEGTEQLDEIIGEAISQHKVLTINWLSQHCERANLSTNEAALSKALKSVGCTLKRSKAQRYYITSLGHRSGLSERSKPTELIKHLPKG